MSLINSSRDLQTAVAMRFLFRLNLSLRADVGKKIGILIFGTKHGGNLMHRKDFRRRRRHLRVWNKAEVDTTWSRF